MILYTHHTLFLRGVMEHMHADKSAEQLLEVLVRKIKIGYAVNEMRYSSHFFPLKMQTVNRRKFITRSIEDGFRWSEPRLRRWVYYFKALPSVFIPRAFHRETLPSLLSLPVDEAMGDRIGYYCQSREGFIPGSEARRFRLRLHKKRSAYQLDFHETFRHFHPDVRVHAIFGDNASEPDTPAFVKSRPIAEGPSRAILLKLNQVRHFHFVRDRIPFVCKKEGLVWRGNACQPQRQAFLHRFHAHPRCDIGHHFKRSSSVEAWNRGPLSIGEQLRYKFILALEGNDVATNLKWVLSSNSLCFMPKPRFETWFMEGRLRAGVHYVELASDFSDLDEKMDVYSQDPKAAADIIRNANAWVDQFRDPRRELRIALHVAAGYLRLSGQL